MKRLLAVFVTLTVSVLFLSTQSAFTQTVNDFVIQNFDAQYNLTNEEKGGKLTTTEKIDLKYSANNHGILRSIPTKYKNWDTNIKILSVERDGQPEPYTSYGENGNLVLKIGDADKTITGEHSYTIRYDQKHVINFDDNQTEFFWDVNGNEWGQPFLKVKATVILDGFDDGRPSACFTGLLGESSRKCSIKQADSQDSSTETIHVFETTAPLKPGENLSFSVPLSEGYYSEPDIYSWLQDNILGVASVLTGLLIAILAFATWFRRGRDYKGKGVIVPEYDPPKKLSAGEIGLLADYRVDSRDITATLIGLAVAGHIKIHEEEKKTIFKKTKIYKLELTNDNWTKLKDHEQSLLKAIFTSKGKNTIIDMKKINKTKMTSAIKKIRKDLIKELTEKYGYFEEDAKRLGTAMIVIGSILFFGGFFLIAIPFAVIGGILAGAALVVFGSLMQRRSHAGTEVYEKIQGLKLYMNTAEKDRLKMMQSVNRPYAKPSQTVDLYEKLLPYAIALGVEKSWTKQFANVLKETPEWYVGTVHTSFNTAVFASSLSSINSSFSSSYASSSSSGSGGFSGGGGGGGGGGGW